MGQTADILAFRPVDLPGGGHEVQEFRRRHVFVERRAFGQVAEGRLRLPAVGDDGLAIDQRIARIRLQHTGDHPHGRGLARAIGPQKAEHRAFLEREGYALHGALGAKAFFQTANVEHSLVQTPLIMRDSDTVLGRIWPESGKLRCQ